jgi:integrase
MSDEITVKVHSYGPERALSLVYFDPISGKKKAKSSGTTNWREAERLAGELEKELRNGRYAPLSRLTWQQFRERHVAERLSTMPESSQVAYRVALDHLERIVDPDRLAKLTPATLSRFQAEARKEGMKATTLARHLRHIKAALRWAERQGMLGKAPVIEMPKLAKGQSLAKHRAVTPEEFDRLLLAVPKVRPHGAPAWERLLRGLWLSGLRLSEAVALDWNDGPFVLDTKGKHPAFYIEAAGQKSRRSEIVPVTPDFAEWILAESPEGQRVGKVFPLVDPKTGQPYAVHTIGPVVSAIGRKAGVVVGQTEKLVDQDGQRVKKAVKLFAGAHDLRRGFCSRWAKRVMPAVLQRLARHAHISTTMGFYVTLDAADMANDLWAGHAATLGNTLAVGNTLGNTAQETTQGAGVECHT